MVFQRYELYIIKLYCIDRSILYLNKHLITRGYYNQYAYGFNYKELIK